MSRRFNNIKTSDITSTNLDINAGNNTGIIANSTQIIDLDNTTFRCGSQSFPAADLASPIFKLGGQSKYAQLQTGITTNWVWTITFDTDDTGWLNDRIVYFQINASGCVASSGASHGVRRYSGTLQNQLGSNEAWSLQTIENLSVGSAPTIAIDTVTTEYNTLTITFTPPVSAYNMGVEIKTSGYLTINNITTTVS